MNKENLPNNIAVPADPRVKIKENEMRDKYLELASDPQKKQHNQKVVVISIAIGSLGKVPKES